MYYQHNVLIKFKVYMSLTSELSKKDSNVSRFFEDNFSLDGFISKNNASIKGCYTIFPSDRNNYPWSDVGHMTEYMMLLHMGLKIEDLFPMWYGCEKYPEIYRDVKAKYKDINRFFKDKELYSELCNDLFRLSKIEGIRRGGSFLTSNEIKKLEINDVILKDMINIYFKSLKKNEIINNKETFFCYNPVFDLSALVGGADADLYLIEPTGNFLIDLKTTVKPMIDKDMIHQLLGYVLLDASEKHNFKDIGVYLTRQNLISKWNIDELLKNNSKFKNIEEARGEFVMSALVKKNKIVF